jgi:CBS domain-containing protein
MVLLDRMIKNKYRRLPVLENNKPIGVVYISNIYYKLF